MFCPNCGAQLPDGVSFCGGCGIRLADELPQPAQPTMANAAPAQQPVYSAQPSQAQTFQQNADPMQQAQPTGYSQPAQAQQPYYGAAQSQQSDTDALMGEFYRAANGYQAQPEAQPMPQIEPQYYTAAPEMAAVKPMKKKKKLIPALCIAAGSLAALAVAGIIVYNCNKASVTHILMGDAGYAHSLVMGTMSAAQDTKAMNTSFAAMASNMNSTNSSSDILNSITSGGYDSSAFSSSANIEEVGRMIEYGLAAMNEAAGVNGMSVKVSTETSIDSVQRDQIRSEIANAGLDPDLFDNIIDFANKIGISSAEVYNNGAYELAASIDCGSEKWLETQLRYEKDGTATVVFPGVSDVGFKMQLPEHSYQAASAAASDLPEYDFSKLLKRIDNATKSVFNEFDYEYTNGKATLNGLEFDGMIVKVKITYSELLKLCSVIIDTAADDAEFMNWLAEATGEDAAYLASSLRSASSELKNQLTPLDDSGASAALIYAQLFSAELTFYVNNDNTVNGFAVNAGYSVLGESQSLFRIGTLAQGYSREFSLTVGDAEYLAVHIKGESESSGRAEFELKIPSYSWDESYNMTTNYTNYGIYLDYSNVGEMQYFGSKALKGDFVISFSDSIADAMTTSADELKDFVRGLKFHLSIAPNGKGATYKIGAEAAGYGKSMLIMEVGEANGSVAPDPQGSYTLIDVNNPDDSLLGKLSEDMQKLYEKLSSSADFKSIEQIISVLQDNSVSMYSLD